MPDLHPFTIHKVNAGYTITLTLHEQELNIIGNVLAEYCSTLDSEMLATDPESDDCRKLFFERRDVREILGRLDVVWNRLFVTKDCELDHAEGEM